jgi:hypothetical protein
MSDLLNKRGTAFRWDADGKLRVEGQKRATQYYPTDSGSGSAKATRATKGVKVKRGRGRPKKKA